MLLDKNTFTYFSNPTMILQKYHNLKIVPNQNFYTKTLLAL